MPSPIPKLSGDASLLISHFAEKPAGYEVSWNALATMIGRDPRESSVMPTVRNRLQRDYGKVLLTIRGVGVKVADDGEVVACVAPHHRRQAHNAAARARKALQTVEAESLDNDKRLVFFREMSLAGVIEAATTEKAAKRIEQHATADQPHLALARTLEALKG